MAQIQFKGKTFIKNHHLVVKPHELVSVKSKTGLGVEIIQRASVTFKEDRSNSTAVTERFSFLDFFAGSGLVTEALRSLFDPVWANDICDKKAKIYRANHASEIFHLGSIEEVQGDSLPPAALSWASFPCQDLSLAGNIGGIESSRSGLVWQWLRVMDEMRRRPPIVVAENVVGLVSANNGENYAQLHNALIERGYRVGAVVIDAIHWVPQSRPRIFVIGVDNRIDTSEHESTGPDWCHTRPLRQIASRLQGWVWWKIKRPKHQRARLDDVIDLDHPCDDERKSHLNIGLIPKDHLRRMQVYIEAGINVFPGYRRTRHGKQVLELRFDRIAGCLRTPQGGSSRQFVVINRNDKLYTRLLTIQEAAALMGVNGNYKIPGTYNDGYKAMGDAVAVPAVKHLAQHLLLPIAKGLIGDGR